MLDVKIKPDVRNRKVFIKIRGLNQSNREGIRKAFYDVGKDLRKTTQSLILEPKHGRIYRIRRGRRIINHRASAPLEAPANLSGTLRKSIGYQVSGSEKMEFGAWAESGNPNSTAKTNVGVSYGKYLEEGTSKMAKRPFLIASIKQNERNTRKRFEKWLKRELNK